MDDHLSPPSGKAAVKPVRPDPASGSENRHSDACTCGAVLPKDQPAIARGETGTLDRHFLALSENAPDIVYVLNSDGTFSYVNPAWEKILGHRCKEVLGRHPVEFAPPRQKKGLADLLCRVLQRSETLHAVEGTLRAKDGTTRHFAITAAACPDASGRAEGAVGTFQDITEKKRIDAELQYLAFQDPVTGLPNRKAFYRKLRELVARSGRRRSDRPWAVLFMDLDRFKQINESMGHDTGDELLKAVAERVTGCLRSTDHLSRIGGDEFTVILTDVGTDLDVARVARKVLIEVARPYNIFGQHIETSVSIGISLYPEDGSSAETLMKNADMAMYAAKQDGAGYQFFTEEMNLRARHRMKMESRLRQAIKRKEMVLYYQPLVDRQGRIAGVEALLRWNHPDMGLLKPGSFIGIAEETGAILPIGQWVLETACRQVKNWRERSGEDLFVAVNLSARQFRDPNLGAMVLETLKWTGLPPRCLHLEVTESSVMEQPETAIKVMRALRRHHISFSIDDFGTGYSSFSYLKRFPIDALKIDRCFVKDSMVSRGDREIIRSIITMARNLRLDIVAEGVENAEQHRFLQNLGCGGMQGFYFGCPLPGERWDSFFSARGHSFRAG